MELKSYNEIVVTLLVAALLATRAAVCVFIGTRMLVAVSTIVVTVKLMIPFAGLGEAEREYMFDWEKVRVAFTRPQVPLPVKYTLMFWLAAMLKLHILGNE